MNRTLALVLAAVAAAGGAAWAWQLRSPEPPEVRAQVSPDDAHWRALRVQLAEERAAREALAEDVAALRARLAALSAASVPPAELRAQDDAPGGFTIADRVASAGTELPLATSRSLADGFDTHALVQAGWGEGRANALKERWERSQLDDLYLRDAAIREGWGMRRLGAERAAARSGLQAEIGIDDYDAMLFAAGRDNRVVVRQVYSESAAERAGLQIGDVILRYDDARVFESRDLRRLTSSGERGRDVPLELLRGGARERLFVQRGPLGVVLGTDRQLP